MNRYSISSDSDRWWYPTGIAATIGAAAVGAIFIVPAMGAPTAPGKTPRKAPYSLGTRGPSPSSNDRAT